MGEQEAERGEDREARSPQEVFEESYLREPTAAALWVTLEKWGLVVALASTLLVGALGSWPVSLGWCLGVLGGFVNISGLRRLLHWLLSAGSGGAVVMGVLLAKMTVLMAGVWAALKYLPASPAAFAAGYGLAMAGLVVGSVILGWRVKASRATQGEPGGLEE